MNFAFAVSINKQIVIKPRIFYPAGIAVQFFPLVLEFFPVVPFSYFGIEEPEIV